MFILHALTSVWCFGVGCCQRSCFFCAFSISLMPWNVSDNTLLHALTRGVAFWCRIMPSTMLLSTVSYLPLAWNVSDNTLLHALTRGVGYVHFACFDRHCVFGTLGPLCLLSGVCYVNNYWFIIHQLLAGFYTRRIIHFIPDFWLTGSDFGTGSVPPDRILSGGCGLSSQNSWGTGCPDVANGRRYYNLAVVKL